MSLWDWHVALVAGKTERSRAKTLWQRVIAVSRKEARAMVFRIASIILRLCAALAVILGILFWSGNALNLIPIHMLLGLLVVLSLWIVGIGQAFSRGGSWPVAGGAFLL